MTFPDAFREHVAPKLSHMMRVGGAFVACGSDDYGAVVDRVLREAYRLGAYRLPEGTQEDLQDWIFGTVLREIDRAEQAIRPGPDIVAHCDAILAGIRQAGTRALIGRHLETEHPEFAHIQRERRRDTATQRRFARVLEMEDA